MIAYASTGPAADENRISTEFLMLKPGGFPPEYRLVRLFFIYWLEVKQEGHIPFFG